MKIFVSWSGEASQAIAISMRDWLPIVIQSLEPYVSSEDLDSGTRWSADLSRELEASTFGILCVTKDNINAPWLVFEAGALSKLVDKSRVVPILFGVKKSEVKGPLLQFQSVTLDEDGIRKLVLDISNSSDPPLLDESRLNDSFSTWWPKLIGEVEQISLPASGSMPEKEQTRSSSDLGKLPEMMEELLELVRSQHRLLKSPDELMPRSYIRTLLERVPIIHSDEEPAYLELGRMVGRFDVELSRHTEANMLTMAEIRNHWRQLQHAIERAVAVSRSRHKSGHLPFED